MKTRLKIIFVSILVILAMFIYLGKSENKYMAYVPNASDGTITIIDTTKGEIVDEIIVGNSVSHGIAVSKDGRYVWATNRFSNDVSVIDIEKKEIVKSIVTNGQANHISILPDSNYAYVSNLESEDISIIDMKSFEIVKTIKVGKEPHEIEFVKVN